MAFKPISNTVPQYHVSGSPASGYYLKFYATGTTTAISMATSYTGATTLARCQLNTQGYPINGSSAVFIPHVNQDYKLVLYTNAADADANTTANAVWVVDNLSAEPHYNMTHYELGTTAAAASHTGVPTGFIIKTDYHGSTRIPCSGGEFRYTGLTASENAGLWPHSDGFFYDADGKQFEAMCPNVLQFGATGNGSTNDQAAIQIGIDYLSTQGGGTLHFPKGTYLLTGVAGDDGDLHGLEVPYTNPGIQGASSSVFLLGEGRDTILKANSASMYVIRWSTSQGGMQGFFIQGNATSTGLALIGKDPLTDTTGEDITHNNFRDIIIGECGTSMRLQSPLGAAGVYYNSFTDIYCYFGQSVVSGTGGRGLYLYTPTIATDGAAQDGTAGQNRNSFINCIFKRMNTGVEIQDGDTNQFFNCSFEDIQLGTSPNTTPTAIKIGAGDISAQSNRFFGGTTEAVTRGVDNNNAYSEFFGCGYGVAGGGHVNLFTVDPLTWMGGYDGSQVPVNTPAYTREPNTSSIDFGTNRITIGAVSETQSGQTEISQSSTTAPTAFIQSSSTSYTGETVVINARRAASSAYYMLSAYDGLFGSTAQRLYGLRGDGNAYTDGAWNNSAADIAKYREWADGNPDNEDRVGLSVTLLPDGKIRESTEGEEPFGVISGAPSFVTGNHWEHWKDKYLLDDYRRPVMESYEAWEWDEVVKTSGGLETVTHSCPTDEIERPEGARLVTEDENGNKLMRRKLNPDYKTDLEYVPYEKRPEKSAVGVHGFVPVRKGQVIGENWQLSGSISDTVDEYFIK